MTGKTRRKPQSLKQIFAVPALIGVLSGIGLVAALLDDGWWDIVGGSSLGIAPLIAIGYLLRRDSAP